MRRPLTPPTVVRCPLGHVYQAGPGGLCPICVEDVDARNNFGRDLRTGILIAIAAGLGGLFLACVTR